MKFGKKIALLLVMALIATTFTGCSSKVCDFCGKQFSGDAYYRGISESEMGKTSCRECAANYWAPLNVENFKK